MNAHPLAGKPAPKTSLVDVPRLISAYYTQRPEPTAPKQLVVFGTSSHCRLSYKSSFNEAHILAISHTILTWLADGIVITPLHNPPEDGGIKYNPPHGVPANTEVTGAIEKTANTLLESNNASARRITYKRALSSPSIRRLVELPVGFKWFVDVLLDGSLGFAEEESAGASFLRRDGTVWTTDRDDIILDLLAAEITAQTGYDYITPNNADVAQVIDLPVIASAGQKIGFDSACGAGLAFWQPLAERHGIKLELVTESFDPTFSFMTLDWDGRIRMDRSSPSFRYIRSLIWISYKKPSASTKANEVANVEVNHA